MKKRHPFKTITVFVEWRCTSEGVPDDRPLRARVCESETHNGGICRAFGDELIAPRKITDSHMSEAHVICLAQLRGLADKVIFRYEALMALEPEEYPCYAEVS